MTHLKIGELARRSGLTVRTLHHYDHIGLLSPSGRTEGGYRLYAEADVVRLHRIQALKHFGCALDEIAVLLGEPGTLPLALVERQIAALDDEARRAAVLRDGLQVLHDKMTRGGDAALTDWLSVLEMMTMYEKHLNADEREALRSQDARTGHRVGAAWLALTAEIEAAMSAGVPPRSPEAAALAARWMALVAETTGNDAALAVRLGAMQEAEPRAQQINGATPAIARWIAIAFAHVRADLFAPFLTPAQLDEVRARQVAHVEEWPPLFAEVRAQMQAGTAPDAPSMQLLARRWRKLFDDSYCGDDEALRARVHAAFGQEPRLTQGLGLDLALVGYVQQAVMMLGLLPPGEAGEADGPKPSASWVAQLRAAHQLGPAPRVFEDPLSLCILGPAGEAGLRDRPAQHADPLSAALGTSLAVRSRVAQDAWQEAQQRGVRQCVILGAGLDTTAYRGDAAPGVRFFEVDLPDTQAWKRRRLAEAGIAEPEALRYVPVDFAHGTLRDALLAHGWDAEAPCFCSWLGVVVYLERPAIDGTLRELAAFAPGSSVVFDYVQPEDAVPPMERIGMETMAARFARQGEPWRTRFTPAGLAELLAALGFGPVEDLGGPALTARYLAGREGARLSDATHMVIARVGG